MPPQSLGDVRLISRLFLWKPNAREIGPDDDIYGEPARLDRFAIVGLRQGAARNLPGVVDRRAKRWAKMREHEVLRSHALCHGAEIGGQALAIIGWWRKSAA